jgi:hypothetical protein
MLRLATSGFAEYVEGLWNAERLKTLLQPVQINESLLKTYAGQYGDRMMSISGKEIRFKREAESYRGKRLSEDMWRMVKLADQQWRKVSLTWQPVLSHSC